MTYPNPTYKSSKISFRSVTASSIFMTPPIQHQPVASLSTLSTSPQKVKFTARYKQWPRAMVSELEEFFLLPWEAFETCDLLQWWVGHLLWTVISEVDKRAECRRWVYWKVVIKSGQSRSWSLNMITVKRRVSFSLCAAPPRSFFVLIYEGSIIN